MTWNEYEPACLGCWSCLSETFIEKTVLTVGVYMSALHSGVALFALGLGRLERNGYKNNGKQLGRSDKV